MTSVVIGDPDDYRYARDHFDAAGTFVCREYSNDPTFASGPELRRPREQFDPSRCLPLPLPDRCRSPLTYRGVDVGLQLTAEDVIRARDHYADTEKRWRTQMAR